MIKKIVAVDVYVSDQDKALDFYEHTLDFEKVADETWDGIGRLRGGAERTRAT